MCHLWWQSEWYLIWNTAREMNLVKGGVWLWQTTKYYYGSIWWHVALLQLYTVQCMGLCWTSAACEVIWGVNVAYKAYTSTDGQCTHRSIWSSIYYSRFPFHRLRYILESCGYKLFSEAHKIHLVTTPGPFMSNSFQWPVLYSIPMLSRIASNQITVTSSGHCLTSPSPWQFWTRILKAKSDRLLPMV